MADKFIKLAQLSHFYNKTKEVFVAKEAGKTLSTNDYTTAEKTKLAGIADGANNYTLPVATTSTLGGIKIGANLSITSDGILSAVQGDIDTYPFETKANAANTYLSKASFNTEMTKYALKSDVATAVVNHGSVQTYADLPLVGQKNGDMYNIRTADAIHNIKAGDNVVWDGVGWDNFGGIFAIDSATDVDIDGLF